ncbi:hypothetical protein [Haloarcula sediminis]|uniref:hypothetical protein n=1 Tax=Haloarcula sediminis TaxID=3111777 RepID=UPI002D78FCD2|nr:hypothetical protein [Haloarcula sp. CK38]
MPSGEKTDLQRDIVLTWYENPNATNKEIADACDCSSSYVSQIKNRFDDYSEMEYMMDRQNEQMEQMFGDGIFGGSAQASGATGLDAGQPADGPGLAEMYEELPDNLAGNLIRVLILLVLLYVVYEVAMILIL